LSRYWAGEMIQEIVREMGHTIVGNMVNGLSR